MEWILQLYGFSGYKIVHSTMYFNITNAKDLVADTAGTEPSVSDDKLCHDADTSVTIDYVHC